MLNGLANAVYPFARRAANAQIKIAVNRTTIESAPLFLAERIPGVELVPVPTGRVAMEQLLHGSVDAATGSETQMLLNSIAEPGIRVVLTLAEARYRIIARRSSGVRRVQDLRGKKVAATGNTSSQYYLREMLRAVGLLESDIHFVSLEGADMPAALKRGDVDAVAIWEPHAQNSLEALGSDAIELQNPSVYRERFNLNTTTRVLQDPDKRRALVEFLSAAMRASERARRQPAKRRPCWRRSSTRQRRPSSTSGTDLAFPRIFQAICRPCSGTSRSSWPRFNSASPGREQHSRD